MLSVLPVATKKIFVCPIGQKNKPPSIRWVSDNPTSAGLYYTLLRCKGIFHTTKKVLLRNITGSFSCSMRKFSTISSKRFSRGHKGSLNAIGMITLTIPNDWTFTLSVVFSLTTKNLWGKIGVCISPPSQTEPTRGLLRAQRLSLRCKKICYIWTLITRVTYLNLAQILQYLFSNKFTRI